MNEHEPTYRTRDWSAPPAIDRVANLSLVVGLVGAALLVVGFFTSPDLFFRAYLVGWTFWLSIALGSLALSMVHHLSGGGWGLPVRRIFEAASRTLLPLGVLFVPLAFGLGSLYPWARPFTDDPVLEHRKAYMNPLGWDLRAVLFFAVWLVLAFALSGWSRRQDATGDPELIRKMRRLAAPGLVLYTVTITLASIDWLMTVNPHWYSTMYGIWFLGGHGVAALAFLILVSLFLSRRDPMDEVLVQRHFHDYGKLLLAFTMLWAYFSVSQLLIVWSGNIPEEVIWYHERLHGGWQWVGLAIALLHFALPFLLLLSRDLKRDAGLLAWVAGLLLVMHWVDIYWNVVPAFSAGALTLSWQDVVAPVALGGLWVWLFVRELKTRPLLPVRDPYLEEAFADGGH